MDKKYRKCDLNTFDFVRNRIDTITRRNFCSEIQNNHECLNKLLISLTE